MASFEEQFIAARDHLERICSAAGEAAPDAKSEIGDLLDHADETLDRLQDVLSEVKETAEAEIGAAAPGGGEHGE